MNIAVAGTGFVGLSIATLLAQRHHVMKIMLWVMVMQDNTIMKQS